MTQSLFSQHHLQSADYYVTSFRKFLAIPEGGALISKRKFIDYDILPADDTIEIVALDAFKLKKEYFENPVLEKKKLFREKYSELNSLICQNDKLQMMGEISKKILFSCDKERITNIRKNNYKYLYDTISSLKDVEIVFNNNLNEVCPLYFPVYVNDRENVQLYLSKYDIYCPIIWKKDKNIVTEDNATRYMYSHMLCIPIDQRYGQLEMNRVVESLSKYSC